jgi:hypothetical protein
MLNVRRGVRGMFARNAWAAGPQGAGSKDQPPRYLVWTVLHRALPQGLGSSHVRPTGHAGISSAITIWAGHPDRSTMVSGRKPVLCI